MYTTIALILASVSTSLHLPQGLLSSLCYVESNHNPKAVHKDDGSEDSIGLCQMHESTARLVGFKGKKVDLMKAQINAYYAGLYLKHQITRYHGNIKKAVAAYNAGSAKFDSQGRIRNNKYVTKVYSAWKEKR